MWGVALWLLRWSRSLRWAWEGFGAVARRWFVAVSMRFCNIGTIREIAARPHVDRHYLSEFLLIVFLLGTWLAWVMSGLEYEMRVGENGSGIGGKGGEGIRMLRVFGRGAKSVHLVVLRTGNGGEAQPNWICVRRGAALW